MFVGWAQSKKDRKRQREGTVNERYVFIHGLKMTITEDTVLEALKDFGEITLVLFLFFFNYFFSQVRLDKLPFPLVRIGYIVFEQAGDAKKLVRTFAENDKFKALFENPANPNAVFLFRPPYDQRFARGNNNYRRSPQRMQQPGAGANFPRFPPPTGPYLGMMQPQGQPIGMLTPQSNQNNYDQVIIQKSF